jgi:hypothetical protein
MKKQPAKKGRTGAPSRSKSASRPSRPSGKRRLGSTVKLPRDWQELIGLLSSNAVRFLVVGAHALAANGRPRATQDIDILVEPTVANARRLAKALAAFGFAELALEWREFTKPDRMASLGAVPLRIDIMTSISGVPFRDAWKGRLRARIGTTEVPFLGVAELKRNKLASGRPKDLADLALLEELDR